MRSLFGFMQIERKHFMVNISEICSQSISVSAIGSFDIEVLEDGRQTISVLDGTIIIESAQIMKKGFEIDISFRIMELLNLIFIQTGFLVSIFDDGFAVLITRSEIITEIQDMDAGIAERMIELIINKKDQIAIEMVLIQFPDLSGRVQSQPLLLKKQMRQIVYIP